MKDLYFHRDKKRGIHKTFIWLIEEVGELANVLRKDEINKKDVSEEMADIIAWLSSLANLIDIRLEKACLTKYPFKCSKCNNNPCECKN
ncbi:MAG: MazG nucleotide pyrophosphohydrolase domain-containing protein [Candidatus Lokiarchaeota archaeon]